MAFIKGKIFIGRQTTTTTTTTKTTGIHIQGQGDVPVPNSRKFPLSLPGGRKPTPAGLPASRNKKAVGALTSGVPFGQGKK